jgi:hypothetical protein
MNPQFPHHRIEPLNAGHIHDILRARGGVPDSAQIEKILLATRHVDLALAGLASAADLMVTDANARQGALASEQVDAFTGSLGAVIEQADALLMVREAFVVDELPLDDEDVPKLVVMAMELSSAIRRSARA